LLYAARDGCYDCVEALLGAGADINIPTPEGVTALMLALDNDQNNVAKLLLDRGANPRLWDWWGRTALYIAIDRKLIVLAGGARQRGVPPLVSSMDIINALLDAGVDVNAQLNSHRPSPSGNSGRFIEPLLGTGCTPLLRATLGVPFPESPATKPVSGDIDVVRALLARGADPNINGMGVTPFLVAAGVNADNIDGTGLAAKHSAGGPARFDLMDLLLEHGANINDQVTGTRTYSMRIMRAPSANEGRTALHIAARDGKTDLVRYLLGKGVNTGITDAAGLKAIDLAGQGNKGVNAPTAPPIEPATVTEIRSLLGKL
jgi:ankyrin repeat protein